MPQRLIAGSGRRRGDQSGKRKSSLVLFVASFSSQRHRILIPPSANGREGSKGS